jgi:hypothetical protein
MARQLLQRTTELSAQQTQLQQLQKSQAAAVEAHKTALQEAQHQLQQCQDAKASEIKLLQEQVSSQDAAVDKLTDQVQQLQQAAEMAAAEQARLQMASMADVAVAEATAAARNHAVVALAVTMQALHALKRSVRAALANAGQYAASTPLQAQPAANATVQSAKPLPLQMPLTAADAAVQTSISTLPTQHRATQTDLGVVQPVSEAVVPKLATSSAGLQLQAPALVLADQAALNADAEVLEELQKSDICTDPAAVFKIAAASNRAAQSAAVATAALPEAWPRSAASAGIALPASMIKGTQPNAPADTAVMMSDNARPVSGSKRSFAMMSLDGAWKAGHHQLSKITANTECQPEFPQQCLQRQPPLMAGGLQPSIIPPNLQNLQQQNNQQWQPQRPVSVGQPVTVLAALSAAPAVVVGEDRHRASRAATVLAPPAAADCTTTGLLGCCNNETQLAQGITGTSAAAVDGHSHAALYSARGAFHGQQRRSGLAGSSCPAAEVPSAASSAGCLPLVGHPDPLCDGKWRQGLPGGEHVDPGAAAAGAASAHVPAGSPGPAADARPAQIEAGAAQARDRTAAAGSDDGSITAERHQCPAAVPAFAPQPPSSASLAAGPELLEQGPGSQSAGATNTSITKRVSRCAHLSGADTLGDATPGYYGTNPAATAAQQHGGKVQTNAAAQDTICVGKFTAAAEKLSHDTAPLQPAAPPARSAVGVLFCAMADSDDDD